MYSDVVVVVVVTVRILMYRRALKSRSFRSKIAEFPFNDSAILFMERPDNYCLDRHKGRKPR